MRKYQHVERAAALAIDDVDTLQYIAKRHIIELKNIARESNSLLVSSIIRSTCRQIDSSINDAIDNARKLLK